jgi:hypothetical protein
MITRMMLMTALIAGGVSVAGAQMPAATPAPADVPTCSKTVTDKCINRTATTKKVVHHKKVVKKTSETTTTNG